MRADKKGIVLIISLMVMAVLLVLTGVYFSGLLTEKKAADTEGFVLQAFELAEAGANHAQSELRERMRTDLEARAGGISQSAVFQPYVADCSNSLRFLRDYAFAGGETQFTTPALVNGEYQTTLDLSVPNVSATLNTAVQGSYMAKIIIKCNGNPTNPESDVFVFPYKYNIEAQGLITRTTPNIARKTGLLYGTFSITVRRGNFARYALFTNHHSTPGGITVWFTANTNFTGPVYTNDRFSFANNPSAHFTEEVTQHLTTARFYNNGSTKLLNADRNPVGCCPQCIQCTAWPGCCEGAECTTCCVENSACSNRPACVTCRDKPTFDTEFTRGSDLINLPSSVTQQDLLNQATGDRPAGSFSTDGIYLPNQDGILDGGIYIRGNSSNLTMSVENNQPVYTVTQGSNTKKITLDYTNNQTIVTNVSGTGGTPAGTYNGIPDGLGNEGILIYDKGSISNFSGTVQSDTKVTVSSDTDISVNNHILYQSYNSGPPLNATGYNNLLGILTWNGNVRISTSAPNNLNIHGVVMAVGRNGVFTVDNYQSGSPRGVVTLLGGVITDFYGPFGTFSGATPASGYGRNFVYDARMLQGMAPPYFPTVTNFDTFISDSNDDGIDDLGNRLIWQDQGV